MTAFGYNVRENALESLNFSGLRPQVFFDLISSQIDSNSKP
ncbi:hypothetical protein Aazo_0053 ['Nostoc azollae' 0708]|jgi:hypothetical protein|uniref:Uncharacterized protein n=1 Tax=Nostoc azollae (strain 0708) TaxID=551115 RepID=D7DVD2_NOSA0|nr:hypothetical protein Aazo_0053 ['Nostoc azollae' 0708]